VLGAVLFVFLTDRRTHTQHVRVLARLCDVIDTALYSEQTSFYYCDRCIVFDSVTPVRPLPEPRDSKPYPDILILFSHRFLGLLSHMFGRTGFPTKYRSASLSFRAVCHVPCILSPFF
jgi:hypothetical protein